MVEELCGVCQPYEQRIVVGDAFVGFDWRRYLFTSDSYFLVQLREVAEPGSFALLGIALSGLPARRRRQLEKQAGSGVGPNQSLVTKCASARAPPPA